MTELKNCPSCGRPIKFEEKYARIMACGYCNSVLEFGEWELNKVWEQWEFIDFPSQFIVWKEVDWENKKVYVKGQLRFEYDWGFFDKFFVLIDWKEYYINEDEWEQKLLIDWKWNSSSEWLLDKPVWENVSLFWKEIFVQESGLFKLSSIKGFINSDLIPWKEYEYLDWVINWKIYYFEKEIWADKIRVNKEV